MSQAIVQALWPRLERVLIAHSNRVASLAPSLIRQYGRTKSDAFALGGYLSSMKDKQGDEVAINIDVYKKGEILIVESNACTSDGAIIADGPTSILPIASDQASIDVTLDAWIKNFELFLSTCEPAVLSAISRL